MLEALSWDRTFAVICEVICCSNSGGNAALEAASVELKADLTASFIGCLACRKRVDSMLPESDAVFEVPRGLWMRGSLEELLWVG